MNFSYFILDLVNLLLDILLVCFEFQLGYASFNL